MRYVSKQLIDQGYIQTYDWTKHEKDGSLEDLKEIGILEKEAVLEADFFLILLPAGKGSHIELGIALAQGKRIFLYAPKDEVNQFELTSTFYHLPEVNVCNGSIDEFVDEVTS